jgi:ketosteroid isomerase-like protein
MVNAKMLRMILSAAAACLLTACAALTPAVTTELDLITADRAFAEAAKARGSRAAFAETMDPIEGVVVRQGVATRGETAIAALHAPAMPFFELRWTPEDVRAARGADLGVTTGTYVRSIAGVDAAKGRYVTVWRRDGTGRWRALMHVGSDEAAIAPLKPAATASRPGELLGEPDGKPFSLTLPRRLEAIVPEWAKPKEQPPRGGVVRRRPQ